MYTEEDAIKHIRKSTGSMLDSFDDDQILNVIDAVWDWQEANGFLEVDLDDSDDDKPDPAEVTNYVTRMLARDKGNLLPRDAIAPIVLAELEFEDSLEDTI